MEFSIEISKNIGVAPARQGPIVEGIEMKEMGAQKKEPLVKRQMSGPREHVCEADRYVELTCLQTITAAANGQQQQRRRGRQ